MLALPGAAAHASGYRKITFVPVKDTATGPPSSLLVPLNEPDDELAAAASDTIMGRGMEAHGGLLSSSGTGKVLEFYKESHVTLQWTSVRRAVRRNTGKRKRTVAAAEIARVRRCCRRCRRRLAQVRSSPSRRRLEQHVPCSPKPPLCCSRANLIPSARARASTKQT